MGILDSFKEVNLNLPIIGTIGGLGLIAGIAIIFLLKRKKTVSFKV